MYKVAKPIWHLLSQSSIFQLDFIVVVNPLTTDDAYDVSDIGRMLSVGAIRSSEDFALIMTYHVHGSVFGCRTEPWWALAGPFMPVGSRP